MGAVDGPSIADQFIRTAAYRHVLVVRSEVHSTGLDFSLRASGVSIIFGDGAGAAILGPAADRLGIITCRLYGDIRFACELMVSTPGTYQRHWDLALLVSVGSGFTRAGTFLRWLDSDCGF